MTLRAHKSLDISAGILVGGRGRRLGNVDKARLMVHGETLLSRIVQAVSPHVADITLARRADQDFQELDLPTVVDAHPDAGPLGGLVALLRDMTTPWCWLIAVDLPRFDAHLLEPLASARAEHADAVVYAGPQGLEPTCALYHRRCLPQAEAMLHHGVHTLRSLIALLPRVAVPLSHTHAHALTNLNSAADWAAINAVGAS